MREMKRDMDLMRELLQRLEALPLRMGEVADLSPDAKELAVEGYSADEVAYHLSLLQEEWLIESPGIQPAVGITFRRLTSTGHDFLERQSKTKTGRVELTKEQNMASVSLSPAQIRAAISQLKARIRDLETLPVQGITSGTDGAVLAVQ